MIVVDQSNYWLQRKCSLGVGSIDVITIAELNKSNSLASGINGYTLRIR